jgi:hypothetical protein
MPSNMIKVLGLTSSTDLNLPDEKILWFASYMKH